MQYLILIYGDEKKWASAAKGDLDRRREAYMEFTRGMVKSGNYRGGEALEASREGVTLRAKEGKTLRHDGPYAETKEQLAGFYLVEARDLEEAATLAAGTPEVQYGGAVEVRAIRPMPKAP
jgi:hypothetical protein